jgi:hypothetical protein
MTRREIAQLAFTEAHTDDEVFMRVSVVGEFVEVLLTTGHHGDIEVYLYSSECKQVLEALEEAVLVIQGANGSVEREIASLRSVRAGTKMELVVNIRVERGLVVFDLAFEGDENEEDKVWVFLTSDQCKWLIEALGKVG